MKPKLSNPTLVLTIVAILLAASCQTAPPANEGGIEVIYTSASAFHLLDDKGYETRIIDVGVPIQGFAIAPDRSIAVFHSGPRINHGGPLSQVNLATGAVEHLTSGSYFTRYGDNVDREVYSGPDFSPDGKEIVFAIHGNSTGSAEAASGPAAVMDLATREVRVLQGTTSPRNNGVTGYANSPKWSPGGDAILVNFEDNFGLTSRDGGDFDFLPATTSEAPLAYAIDWVGPGCILYMSGATWDDAANTPARIFRLATRDSIPAAGMLGFSERALTDVIAFTPRMLISAEGDSLIAEPLEGEAWEIPTPGEDVSAIHIAGGYSEAAVPAECR